MSAVDAARRFYALPIEEKMKLEFRKNTYYRGYYPITKKKYSHESFELGPDVNVASNSSLSGPNHALFMAFRNLKLSQEVVGLGMKLLSAFALALNLPEDYFADKVQTTPATMRLTYYPPQAQAIDNGAPGLGEHTDFQLFTILWQDENRGLQALNPSGQWIDVAPVSGTLVIK
ncbi:hypothetical protein RhiTH_001707 [Rhizoctonia solani]